MDYGLFLLENSPDIFIFVLYKDFMYDKGTHM